MSRRLGRRLRRWFLLGGTSSVIPTPPPVIDYWPKLDFTDYRNSMYSCGGF